MEKWKYKEIPISDVKELLKNHTVQVESPDGYVSIKEYIEKGKKKLLKFIINGKTILCSENHLFETLKGWKFAKDLQIFDLILCDDNKYHFFTKINIDKEDDVVDIYVDHPNHRYYTNGISSHNTNMGKSLIKTGFATNTLLQNKNVLYITLEMSEGKVAERIMANLFDIELNDLYTIPKDRFMYVFEKVKETLKNRLLIKEFPTRSANTNRIRNLLKELDLKNRFVPDIIYVDYMSIMVPNKTSRQNNTNTELKIISEELRGLSMELSIPIVSSVQTNRGGFGESELELTDIAESIGVTGTADIIIGISQTDDMRLAGRYLLLLLKNRYGLNKIQSMVGVDYKKMRIYEVSDENENTDINTSHGKPITPKGTESTTIIDETAVKVIKTLKNNRKTNKNKIMKNKPNNDIKM